MTGVVSRASGFRSFFCSVLVVGLASGTCRRASGLRAGGDPHTHT